MGWPEIFSELEVWRRQLDRQGKAQLATQEKGYNIFCCKGCSNCCSLSVNCSFPEAIAIAKMLPAPQIAQLEEKLPLLQRISEQAESLTHFLRLFRDRLGGCPFLSREDGSCRIYAQRPFSCRALISTRNSSWCAVDFADLHPLEKEAFLSSLDSEIVAFPTHYLAQTQELGRELETQAMVAMREAFGVSLSGNLLYQVWLELEYGLSEVVLQGYPAARAFLEERKLDLPYLLQMQGD